MLFAKQSAILDAIEQSVRERGYPPAVRELQQRRGISSTSLVTYHLKRLEAAGYISRRADVSRGITLLHRPSGDDRSRQVPLLGRIAAGEPLRLPDALALADSAAMLTVAAEWLPRTTNLYALEVRGDSMVDALIGDGDVIVVDRDAQAAAGAMAVVWLRDRCETTLKRVYLEGDTVRLVPANPTMQPFSVPAADVDIQGCVILVVRRPAHLH